MSKKKPGIIGMYVLTFKPSGFVQWQGRIKSCDGDDIFLDLFEWSFGYPIGQVGIIKRSELYDGERVHLFSDDESWREAAAGQARRSSDARKAGVYG